MGGGLIVVWGPHACELILFKLQSNCTIAIGCLVAVLPHFECPHSTLYPALSSVTAADQLHHRYVDGAAPHGHAGRPGLIPAPALLPRHRRGQIPHSPQGHQAKVSHSPLLPCPCSPLIPQASAPVPLLALRLPPSSLPPILAAFPSCLHPVPLPSHPANSSSLPPSSLPPILAFPL